MRQERQFFDGERQVSAIAFLGAHLLMNERQNHTPTSNSSSSTIEVQQPGTPLQKKTPAPLKEAQGNKARTRCTPTPSTPRRPSVTCSA